MYSLKIWSLVIVGAVVTVACGDSKSSMNPVAPSAVVIGAQSEEPSGANGASTATGKPANPGNGNGNDKEKEKEKEKGKDQPTVPSVPTPGGNVTPPGTTPPPAPTTKNVQLEGLISAKAAASVTVGGQVVNVPSSAVIRHGSRRFEFADLRVGDRVHVKATRVQPANSVSPSTSTLEATEVKLQNPGDADDEDDPSDPPASVLVSVTAVDANASESGPDPGAFRLTRSGETTAALTVTFTLTGTATNGADYQLPLAVTFTAGQATASVVVVPLTDATVEGPETVILTVVDGAGYSAGAPATATVTIAG